MKRTVLVALALARVASTACRSTWTRRCRHSFRSKTTEGAYNALRLSRLRVELPTR